MARKHSPPSLDTYFAVVNSGEESLPIRIEVLSSWGIPIPELESRLVIRPAEVLSFDLGRWILTGELPNRQLSEEELAHIQAVLCGQPSPVSGLYYSTLDVTVDPLRAVGSVVVTPEQPAWYQGEDPLLWGDFFIVAPGEDFAQGEVLANLDPYVSHDDADDDDLCRIHAVRFLQGGGFSAGTELMLWNRDREQPSEAPFFPGDPVPAVVDVFAESGRHVATLELELEPLQWIRVEELGLPVDFGWLRIDTAPIDIFITVRYSAAERYSAGFEAFCLPVRGTPAPGIQLEKRLNGETADVPPGVAVAPGAELEWTFEVTNNGNVELVDIEVSDDALGGEVSCPAETLAPGAAMVCTATGLATECSYGNTATVTARALTQTVETTDPAYYYHVTFAGAVDVEKSVNGIDADAEADAVMIEIGGTAAWEVVITNGTDTRLYGIELSDARLPGLSFPHGELAPGDSMACSAEEEVLAGLQRNEAAVTARVLPETEDPACHTGDGDPSHYFGFRREVRIEKSTNGEDGVEIPVPVAPFGLVEWTFEVTNLGNVELVDVAVTDSDPSVAVSCPGDTLAAGASMTCTASGIADTCRYQNTATVVARVPGTDLTVTDDDSSGYVVMLGTVDIEKSANGVDADDPGDAVVIPVGEPVTWELVVTNPSTYWSLYDVVVADPRFPALNCSRSQLSPGAALTCIATEQAAADLQENVAAVSARMLPGTEDQACFLGDDDASHYFGEDPRIDLEKHTEGYDADDPTGPSLPVGSTVHWTYHVSNLGNVALVDVQVTDDQGVSVDCGGRTTLAVGASMICNASGVAQACGYANVGTATARSEAGTEVDDTDPSHYWGEPDPGFTFRKMIRDPTTGQWVDANTPTRRDAVRIPRGQTVHWLFEVTNTGNVALDVTITDGDLGFSCELYVVPGGIETCTTQGVSSLRREPTRIEPKCHYHCNEATAVATPLCGEPLEAADSACFWN